MSVELASVSLLDVAEPRRQPRISAETYESRVESALLAARAEGLDALVVYADREHFASMSFLTGFDPRFEEALLVLRDGRDPVLVVGNECKAYAAVVEFAVELVVYQPFSLLNQPRSDSKSLDDVLSDAGLSAVATPRVGVVGSKFFGAGEAVEAGSWIDAPAYLVDRLRALGMTAVNASGLFMNDTSGLRVFNDADQIAVFEFAATHAGDAVRRLIGSARPGMTELEASRGFGVVTLPHSYHPVLLSGQRTKLGLASASDRELCLGDPMSTGFGYWGGNTARGGYLAESAADLPADRRDYVERVVAPYFETAAVWLETIGLGVSGGELFDVVHRRLGGSFFSLFLNPGHYIHLEEWPNSPVYRDSTVGLASGMALQLDIIPFPPQPYHTTNIEDGVALADEDLRAELAQRHPDVWSRMQARRAYLADELNIHLKPEVLPLSNTCGYLPPFWLSPGQAMRVSR